MNRIPTIGQPIHYVLEVNDTPALSLHRAGIIVRVIPDPDGKVRPGSAIVAHVHFDIDDDGGGFAYPVIQRTPQYDPTALTPGTWHWPDEAPDQGALEEGGRGA